MDVPNAYHLGILWKSQMGAFLYVIPSKSEDDGIILCIDLVPLMGWVESPKFFCAFYETLTDRENSLVNTKLLVTTYVAI